MGRPSKLSPDQWKELERRLNAGESAAILSREFGISQGVISNKFSKVSKEIRKTAEVLAAGANMLAQLPVAQQYQAMSLADKLRNISNHLAGAAEFGAATAHRLSGIANGQVAKIDDANPMESHETLQAIATLTKMANDSSVIGVNLLNANKEQIRVINNIPAMEPTIDASKLDRGVLRAIMAAKDAIKSA